MTEAEVKALALIYDLARTGLAGGPSGSVLQERDLSALYMVAHRIIGTFEWRHALGEAEPE